VIETIAMQETHLLKIADISRNDQLRLDYVLEILEILEFLQSTTVIPVHPFLIMHIAVAECARLHTCMN